MANAERATCAFVVPDIAICLMQSSAQSVEPLRDERALVGRIRAGDEAALVVLFRQYYPGLCEFAAGMVGGLDTAEEVVQEVFIRVWDRRVDWQVADSVRAYLYGAVRNRARNWVRDRGVEQRWIEAQLRDVDVSNAPTAPDVDEAIARAVARLPERCREVYTLRWHHELSYVEIAATLGISVKTVDAQLVKAMRILREEIAADR